MKLSDFIPAIEATIQDLNESREREALLVTTDGIALVTNRVTNTGTNAQGSKFSAYSKNDLPLFWFGSSYGQDGISPLKFNVDTKRKEFYKQQKKKAGKGQDAITSYADWRTITGRQTSFKNFTFDGQMFASIRAFVKSKTGSSVDVEIKSSIKKYNDKVIPHHSNEEGINILQLSESERSLTIQAFKNRRLAILRKHGLIK